MDITGIGAVAGLVKTVVDKVWPDKTQVEKDQLALAMLAMQGELAQQAGQVDIDKAEAESPSLFKSGWRPFVGWVCASACAWNWIGLPILKAILTVWGVKLEVMPADLSQMFPLLLGLLGMGTLRTWEKVQGVASK